MRLGRGFAALQRRGVRLLAAAAALVVIGCSGPAAPTVSPSVTAGADGRVGATMMDDPKTAPAGDVPTGAQPQLAADPAQLADDLVADEQALHDPSTSATAMVVAAHRQQAAYRAIGRHPDWDALARPRIPSSLVEVYDRNVDARRQLTAMAHAKDLLPPWRIVAPAGVEELLADYREAEAASGVGWNYLAAINLIETQFGSIDGLSTAGAQGPMQFLPATFATYGAGGDITSPHDSIMAACRYLAADEYVRAVDDYAAALAADPATFTGYHLWNVYYYYSSSGDVLLPIGYAATSPVPVRDYLATHPQ